MTTHKYGEFVNKVHIKVDPTHAESPICRQ